MKPPVVITGRMVLFGILAFFGVIFMVNGAFVYFALDSWPGLTTGKAYEQGRDYNQTLSGAEVQHSLGWSSQIEFTADQERHVFRIIFVDNEGHPLSGLRVHASFQRPVGDENVIDVVLPEIARGEYRSPISLPFAGRWHASIEAGMNDDVRYRMRYVVTVEP